MINKHKVETFIVPRLGATSPAPADRLWNLTTDVVNLPVGGFGMYEPVVNSSDPEAIVAAPTITNTPVFKFIQHRDTANDRTPLPNRKYIQTGDIKADCLVSVRGTAASFKNNGCWLTGGVTGSGVGEVPVLDETEYIVNVAKHGWRTDQTNGYNTPLKMGRFTTPDYFTSTIYTTLVQQRDHILQNVAFDFNNQSQQDTIAFCIDSAATAATVGTNVIDLDGIIALVPGDIVFAGFTDAGQPIKLTLDVQLIQMFTNLRDVYGLPGTVQFVPYARPSSANLTVAARIIAGGRIAATPQSQVDHILYVSLNQKEAYYDEVPQTKERIQVGLDGGFGATTGNLQAVAPEEGSGYGSELNQYYNDMFNNRLYPGGKAWQPNSVKFSSEVLNDAFYDVYVVEYCFNRTASSGLNSTSPQKIIIALVNTTIGTAATNPYFGAANPQKAYLEARLNSWMTSTGFPFTAIAL